MRNIRGAFVVVKTTGVEPHLISATAFELFMDRVRVSGADKANRYTFGNDTVYVLPCVTECMESIALEYTGIHATQVKAICARIALGQALGDDSKGNDNPQGGLGIAADHTKPKAPKGSGGAKAPKGLTADSLSSMLKA